jgi:hypothetical protein
MGGKWRILPHRSGNWLVHAGGHRMVVPEVPARWLAPLEGRRPDRLEVLQCLQRGNRIEGEHWSEEQINQTMDRLTELLEAPVCGPSRRSLWLRIPLVSARGVRVLARPLEILTKGWALAGLMIAGIVAPLLPSAIEVSGPLDTGDWLAAVGLFFAGAVFHELGHAAALSAQGYPAGGIGAGVLFVIPVLHSDVSAISQLPTGGKLRVDMAGVALQVGYGAVLVLIAGGPGVQDSAWVLASRMTYFAVVWNLIPFIRADGYWALCDAFGFRDLDRGYEGVPSKPKLVFLLIHRILNIVFLGLVAVVLPVSWASRLGAVLPMGLGAWASVIVPGLILILWGAMAKRIYRLIGVLVLDFRLWKRTP